MRNSHFYSYEVQREKIASDFDKYGKFLLFKVEKTEL